MEKSSPEVRSFLMRKLLAVCPICKKQIYGKDLDIQEIDKSKINHWPFKYTHCHSNDHSPMHALTMYIDSNFSVRGCEISDFMKIQE